MLARGNETGRPIVESSNARGEWIHARTKTGSRKRRQRRHVYDVTLNAGIVYSVQMISIGR